MSYFKFTQKTKITSKKHRQVMTKINQQTHAFVKA